jgi:hypothetical protein
MSEVSCAIIDETISSETILSVLVVLAPMTKCRDLLCPCM